MMAAVVATTPLAALAQTAPPPASAIYVAEFEVTDMDGIKPYSAHVESTFAPFGGRFIVRGGRLVSQEGVVFTRFNRHLSRSKLNWRMKNEKSEIPG